nr:hypothetical protein [Tanacetum cinerariifolium]
MQTQTSNALHNAIMKAGGKDRPPMFAPGNYVQWKSRIKRYIDTKPNHELIHYCLQNPPYKYKWADKDVLVTEGSSKTTTERSQQAATRNRGKAIVNSPPPIYEQEPSMVTEDDEMSKDKEIDKLMALISLSFKNIYKPTHNNNLRTSSNTSRANQDNSLRISRGTRYDNQRIVNVAGAKETVEQADWKDDTDDKPEDQELEAHYISQQAATKNRGKAIINSPLPIYDQEPSMVAEDDKMSKDKEIDKLMALISLSFKKIYKPTNNNLRTSSNTSRANQDNSLRISRGTGYDNERIGNVDGTRETVGTTVVQKSRIQCYNCKEFRHVAMECQKPKRAKDAAYHKEKMLLCKQEEAGFQLNAEQADWRDDTDDEPEDQELEAHYMYMAQIQEVNPDAADNPGPIFDTEPLQKVPNNDSYNMFAIESEHPEQSKSINDTYPIEKDIHIVIIDSLDMSYEREQVDQDDNDDDLVNERKLLASLIEKLKCEIDDSKIRNKFLETSNKALVDKLRGEIEDFKNKNKSLESSNNHFKEANNKLSKTNQLMYKDLKKFQAKLDRHNDVKYASKVEIDCAKAKGDLMSYKMKSEKLFNAYTRKINDLNQTISEMKKELFTHQETISIMSQAKEAQLKFYKTRVDKEIDKVIVLENKIKDLDNIVYKTDQSVQTMNMLNRNYKTSFAKHEFLKKAKRANPHMYDIGCYNDNLALMLVPESDEMVNTRTDADLSAAVQNALQTLLPQIHEEFRTSSGPSDSGGNPPPVTIHTLLERFNKQKPRSFEKATAPMDAEN